MEIHNLQLRSELYHNGDSKNLEWFCSGNFTYFRYVMSEYVIINLLFYLHPTESRVIERFMIASEIIVTTEGTYMYIAMASYSLKSSYKTK